MRLATVGLLLVLVLFDLGNVLTRNGGLIGVNMGQFADAEHLASWAGLCPGSHESAGKRKSGKTRRGIVWLRRCLCQAAWAVSTKKNNYRSVLYRRLAARRGKKRAVIAVDNRLLQIAYCLLRDGKLHRELGADYFDRLHPNRTERCLVKRLEGTRISGRPRAGTPITLSWPGVACPASKPRPSAQNAAC